MHPQEYMRTTAASPSAVHIDQPLTDFASAYEPSEYFADVVSPIKTVTKRSGKYFTYARRDLEQVPDDVLSPQGEANEVFYSQGNASYNVQDRGLRGAIPAEVERNADAPLNPMQDETEYLMNQIALAREIRVATLFTTSGNYATGNFGAVSNAWTSLVNGTPLSDIDTGRAAIAPGGSGSRLVFICSFDVWKALRIHPDFLGLRAGGGTQGGGITRAEFAAAIECDEVLVSEAYKTTTNEGQGTITRSRIWGTTVAVLARVPASVSGARVQAFSVTFREDPGFQVRQWREEKRGKGGTQMIQVEMSDDEVVVQNDSAYLFTSVA